MAEDKPETLREWREYISNIDDDEIVYKARAANKWKFVEGMKEEGFTSEEVTNILYMFAKELQERDKMVTGVDGNQYLSFRKLLSDMDHSGTDWLDKE